MGSHTMFRTTPGPSLCGIVQTFCSHTHIHTRAHTQQTSSQQNQKQTREKKNIKKIDVGGGRPRKRRKKKGGWGGGGGHFLVSLLPNVVKPQQGQYKSNPDLFSVAVTGKMNTFAWPLLLLPPSRQYGLNTDLGR